MIYIYIYTKSPTIKKSKRWTFFGYDIAFVLPLLGWPCVRIRAY